MPSLDHSVPTDRTGQDSVLATLRVAFVAEGDAETNDCWSGSGRGFVQAMRRAGHRVDVFNVELRGASRLLGAALSFAPNRSRWRQRYILGGPSHLLRSRYANELIRTAVKGARYDAVVQVGASFRISPEARSTTPLVMYCDANAAMARSAGEYSEVSLLSPSEYSALKVREAGVYRDAARIWTFSDHLARSFHDDFGIDRSRLRTIFGGANREGLVSLAPREAKPATQRILFVGKQYQRKGLDVLLQAFASVRQDHPQAELHLVGPPATFSGSGVVSHGVVNPDDTAGAELLRSLYAGATVFCLPSRYEPFGISFVEAMLASVPCIGVRRWAMPEIIDDGQTGRLVSDASADQLAEAIGFFLSHPDEAYRMGLAARKAALERFTWDAVVARATQDLRMLQRS